MNKNYKHNYCTRYSRAFFDGDKVPRKAKKAFLGSRISKQKLKRLLKTVKIISRSKTMYEIANIYPYIFCPACGCTSMRGSGNMETCPNHREYFYCIRCHKIVGYIDNSPFVHALECADSEYDPLF